MAKDTQSDINRCIKIKMLRLQETVPICEVGVAQNEKEICQVATRFGANSRHHSNAIVLVCGSFLVL